MDKVERHEQLCGLLNEIYAKKNHDYGDSFGESYKEWGMVAALVRMSDKWNRLKALCGGKEAKVKDESILDTLIDLANYSLMFYLELSNTTDKKKGEEYDET